MRTSKDVETYLWFVGRLQTLRDGFWEQKTMIELREARKHHHMVYLAFI